MPQASPPGPTARRTLLVGSDHSSPAPWRPLWASTAPQPAPPNTCVVSFGVTQTSTTVTGTGANDTVDCGSATSGKTVNGVGGNDTPHGFGVHRHAQR